MPSRDSSPRAQRTARWQRNSWSACAPSSTTSATFTQSSPSHRDRNSYMPSPDKRSWYDDAKFGIFIHWGLYALAGWAETIPTFDPRHSNYVEWYLNTILIENSPAQVRHRHLYKP